ncbi:SMP-30/gluconolactonase/LRE family protein [Nesterenkonia sp. CF4.4]|uniref:SMP-30/gluconolactonase/LRE family protein n=1 Tax=Nesterenkonia sp. CF4.4 TaxID=3373079 RepID=UPI003EE4BA32
MNTLPTGQTSVIRSAWAPVDERRLFLGEGARFLETGVSPVLDAEQPGTAQHPFVLVDILDGTLYSTTAEPSSGLTLQGSLDAPLGAVAPVRQHSSAPDGRWVAALGKGLALLERSATGELQIVETLGEPAADRSSVPLRMNDAVADPHGRFWAGAMAYDGDAGQGFLLRLDPDGSIHIVLDDLAIPNGPAFSADGATMYLADTPTGWIRRYRVDIATGALDAGEDFIHISEGGPDGMTVDVEDCLWSAVWGASCLHRYSPSGELLERIDVPVRQPTSIALSAAPPYRVMVTSATENLEEPTDHDGRVITAEVSVAGRPAVSWLRSPAQESQANWAGNLTYSSTRLERPRSIDELARLVAESEQVKALGSRHSFSSVADTTGTLIELTAMPQVFTLDAEAGTVTFDAATRYGDLAAALQAEGWALPNMASLPHITVAGSVATGTHGSGDRNPPLASSVRSLDMVLADGSLRTFRRGDADFDGAVVSLGALGVVTTLTLDVVPSFEVRQDIYDGVSWGGVLENFEELTGAAYSVSLFTRWVGEDFGLVWMKSTQEPPAEVLGVTARREDIGLAGGPPEFATEQGGRWGSWDQRLPHFRLDFTPSNGDELQTEYLLPRENAVEGLRRMRALSSEIEPLLLISEIRTMAADDQWMSGASGRETVGFHFTWLQREEEVAALLPRLEEQLLPLGARPHWGKRFATTDIASFYPRVGDFTRLAQELDPKGTFRNAFLNDLLFGAEPREPRN